MPVSPEALSSLREYVLVSRDAMRVEVFVGDAPPSLLTRFDERLVLASLDFSLSLAEPYA